MAARMTRNLRSVWAALACAVMAGCGGGGGGSGGGGADGPAAAPVSVSNVRFPPMDHEAFEGSDRIPSLTITADVVGDLSRLANSTVYVIVEDPDQLYAANPQLNLTSTGLGNQLTLNARGPNTKTGDFRGNLKVNVCMDAACRQPFGGSPFSVPYHLRVLPGLKVVQQGEITLSAKFGDPLPTWQSAISLPAGTTAFSSAVFNRGSAHPSSTVEVQKGAGALTLQGRPIHAMTLGLDLRVEAEATTPSGRKVTLTEIRPITYAMTEPDTPSAAYGPASGVLTRALQGRPGVTGYFVTVMGAHPEQLYVAARVEYLGPANGGLDDAKGVQWLTMGSVSPRPMAADLLYPAEGSYSLSDDCRSISSCLPVGRYLAKVWFSTANGKEATQPFVVRLDVTP